MKTLKATPKKRLITLLFAIFMVATWSTSIYAATKFTLFKPCAYKCDYDKTSYYGANYYDNTNTETYKYNKILGKFNVANLVINNGPYKRNGFIALGFRKHDCTKFIDIGVRFADGQIDTFCMNQNWVAIIKDKIGTYKLGKASASSISYIDITAYLKRDTKASKDLLCVDYTLYDANWQVTKKSYSKDITGYFTYSSKNGYRVEPYNFVSLVPPPNTDLPHNDGSYFKGVQFFAGKYSSSGSLIPFNEGALTIKCTNNIIATPSKYNSNLTSYLVKIMN